MRSPNSTWQPDQTTGEVCLASKVTSGTALPQPANMYEFNAMLHIPAFTHPDLFAGDRRPLTRQERAARRKARKRAEASRRRNRR